MRPVSLAITASLLTACTRSVPGQDLTCDEIPGWLDNQSTSPKQYEVVEQCVHKWGYRLALASGSAHEISGAVLYRCRDALLHYKLLRLREGKRVTDEESAALDRELTDLAVMRIVQQRAGQCSLKPNKG